MFLSYIYYLPTFFIQIVYDQATQDGCSLALYIPQCLHLCPTHLTNLLHTCSRPQLMTGLTSATMIDCVPLLVSQENAELTWHWLTYNWLPSLLPAPERRLPLCPAHLLQHAVEDCFKTLLWTCRLPQPVNLWWLYCWPLAPFLGLWATCMVQPNW